MTRYSDPFQTELNGLPFVEPPPLGLNATDGRDTAVADGYSPITASLAATDGRDTGGRFAIEVAYSNNYEEVVVPPGVYRAMVQLVGASGGDSPYYPGGRGGLVEAEIAVVPGETLRVYAGGKGTYASDVPSKLGGFNGGGDGGSYDSGSGGGGTDIRRSPYALADRLLVAGGGGAAHWGGDDNFPNEGTGGYGGYPNGGGLSLPSTVTPQNGDNEGFYDATGGGGTQTEGGFAGYQDDEPVYDAGSLGQGGHFTGSRGSGGGGGYYGGGASGGYFIYAKGGAGGGSGYIPPGTDPSSIYTVDGFNAADSDGYAAIGWVVEEKNFVATTDGADTVAAVGVVAGRSIEVVETSTDNYAKVASGTTVSFTGPTMQEGDVLIVSVGIYDTSTTVTAPGGFGFVEVAHEDTYIGIANQVYTFAAQETAGGVLDGATLTFTAGATVRIDAAMTVLRPLGGRIDFANPTNVTVNNTRPGSNGSSTHAIPTAGTTPPGSVNVGVLFCDGYVGDGTCKFWSGMDAAPGHEYIDQFKLTGEVQRLYRRNLMLATHTNGDGTALASSDYWCVESTTGLYHDQVQTVLTFAIGPEVNATDGRDTVVGVGYIDTPAVGTLALSDGIDIGQGAQLKTATLAEVDGIDTAAGVGNFWAGAVVEDFTFANSGTSTAAGSFALTKPGGVAVGDLLVLLCAFDVDSIVVDYIIPSGWTKGPQSGTSTSGTHTVMFWRIADGTEGATEIIDGTNYSNPYYYVGWYLRITKHNSADPIDVEYGSTAVTTGTLSTPTVTTTNDNVLVFSLGSFEGDPTPELTGTGWATTTWPTDQEQQNNVQTWGAWQTKQMFSAGDAGTVGYGPDSGGWSQIAFGINPSITFGAPTDGTDTATATGVVDTPLGAVAVTDGADTGGWEDSRIFLIDDPTDSLQWNTSSSGSNNSLTAPDNLAYGDVLVVGVACEAGTITGPAGWTRAETEVTSVEANTIEIWYIPETVGLDVNNTSYTFINNGSAGMWTAWIILRPTSGEQIALPPAITATATGSGTSSHTVPALTGGRFGSFAVGAGTIDSPAGTPNNNWDAPWVQLSPDLSYFNKYFTFAYQEIDAWDGEVSSGAWNDNTDAYATVAAMFELKERFSSSSTSTDGIDTVAASGTIPLTGAVDATDGTDTLAATGANNYAGALAETDGRDTVAGNAVIPVNAAVSLTDGRDTLAATALSPVQAAVSLTDGIDHAFAYGTGPEVPYEYGVITTAFSFAAPIDPITPFTLTTESVLLNDLLGVTVADGAGTSTHTVIAGTTSLTAGAGTVLTGDYAYRGLYSFDVTTTNPGDVTNDGRDWVTLASWGDFSLELRREVGTTYRIQATYITAATDTTYVIGQITVPNDLVTSLGLGVTRNATTGAISLWRSTDTWATWTQIPTGTNVIVAGALPDSAGDSIVILGGDLQDDPWISVFRAQWGGTTDITAVDANEVMAWNYGANIVTGVGGDFYDVFDKSVYESNEFGQNSSYVYSQRVETTDAGTTIRGDFTFNAPTLATGTPTAGTETALTYNPDPLWETSPPSSTWGPRIGFTSTSQFTVNRPNLSVVARQEDGTAERYRVVVVEMDGTPIIACDNAKVGPITWSLNEAESFGFEMPTNDLDNEYIGVTDTEVQIWRGDSMLVWGVVVRSLVGQDTVDYQCRGLAWYFTKRFVGGPRNNFLGNPSFESNGYWFGPSFAPTEHPLFALDGSGTNWTSAITTERSLAGFPGKSLRLYSNDVIEFGVSWFQFMFSEIDNYFWPDGITWTAAAWVYIPSPDWGYYDAETGKVIGERNTAYNWGGESAPFGLHLGRFSSTESQEQDIVGESYPKVYEINVASINEDTPRDQWVRLEVSVVQPPVESGIFGTRTDWMQVELHCPQGVVYWDEVSLTRNDRLFYNDVAQEAILFDIIQHAQDPDFGKTDLNIGFAAAPITNINRTRTYDFFNRRLISDIIGEFTDIWDGVDWSIETTPTSRLFSPWFPMKGTRRPAQALVGGRNIATLSIANDGEQIFNRAVVMSDGGGTGSSREEVIGTNGEPAVVLETSINAIPESPLDSLEGQLQQALRSGVDGVIPTITTYEGVGSQLLGQVSTGDIVPVSVAYGGLSLQGDYRIVSLTWNPDDETMDFTLNPFDDYRDPGVG